jgi:hypothetical protein
MLVGKCVDLSLGSRKNNRDGHECGRAGDRYSNPSGTVNDRMPSVDVIGSLGSAFNNSFSGLADDSLTNNGGSNQAGCGFEEVTTFPSGADVKSTFSFDNSSGGLPGNANSMKRELGRA